MPFHAAPGSSSGSSKKENDKRLRKRAFELCLLFDPLTICQNIEMQVLCRIYLFVYPYSIVYSHYPVPCSTNAGTTEYKRVACGYIMLNLSILSLVIHAI